VIVVTGPVGVVMAECKEKGVYLIVVALASVVIVGLIALTLGLGFVSTGKVRMQAVADLTATAALDSYFRSLGVSESEQSPEAARKEDALARAQQVLDENRVPGVTDAFGSLKLWPDQPEAGDSGYLQFGIYYEAPPEGDNPCAGDYPCFLGVAGNDLANAARLVLHTQEGNPFISRAAGLLGQSRFALGVESTARVKETCTAYLVDVSLTSTRDEFPFASTAFHMPGSVSAGEAAVVVAGNDIPLTHPSLDGTPPREIPPPVPFVDGQYRASLYAYRARCILDESDSFNWQNRCTNLQNFQRCADHESGETPGNPDLVHWCSMRESRGDAVAPAPTPAPGEHFRSDYVLRPAFDGEADKVMLVSKYRTEDPLLGLPRPLDHYMRGFNAGLRLVTANANADRAVLMAFTGRVHGRIVPHPQELSDDNESIWFSSDLDYLIQITNMHNMGRVGAVVGSQGLGTPAGGEVVPNFIDKGFFPSYYGFDARDGTETALYSATNVVEALWDASEALVTQCPAHARKQIVLATDGRISCNFNLPDEWGGTKQEPDCDPAREWEHYQAAEQTLLYNLAGRLQEENIALTTILSGESVRMRYRNIKNPDAEQDCEGQSGPYMDQNCFLNFNNFQAYGHSAFSSLEPSGNLPLCHGENSIFPCGGRWASSVSSDGTFTFASGASNAVHQRSYEQVRYIRGAQFGRALSLFGHLAANTGGMVCPLLQRGAVGHYVNVNVDPEYQNVSCDNLPAGAIPCVLKNSVRNQQQPGMPPGVSSRALHYLDPVDQAARCIEEAIGKNLYSLGRPLRIIDPD